MPLFLYKARDPGGALREGRQEGASASDVAAQLAGGGAVVLSVVEAKAAASAAGKGLKLDLFKKKTVPINDLIFFSRQMYSLLKAGVPILRTMHGLSETTRNPVLAQALRDIGADLEGGRELSTALHKHPAIFSSLYVSMVKVGENSGQMENIFERLAAHLQSEKEIRDRVKSALRYPVIVVCALALALTVINVFVIPSFAGIFARSGVALPLPTRILIGLSNFTIHYWPAILVTLAGIAFAARRYVRTPDGRLRWDRLKLRLPLFGSIIRRSLLARFARSFALAFRSGVPLVVSLGLVARAADNRYLETRIEAMRESIERGDNLTRSANSTGLFTPLVLQMLSVGEESGNIDMMMDEVADFYEREVDYDLKNLSAAIEPILLVFVGIMVLVLALGVFLPMWDMASAVKR